MESRWYFFPGQTPQNTKISDRAHALHITGKSWTSITKHLDRKRLIQEAMDKEKAYKQALKDGSTAMTKQWKNSTENIRVRKEQERYERSHPKKDDKFELFHRMKAEQETKQEVKRQQICEQIKKELFISSGYPRELTSALILSETLFEREKQKEFNEKLKEHQKEIDAEYAKTVRENAEKLVAEAAEEANKEKQKKEKLGETLRKQIAENEHRRKEERASHVAKEIRDQIKATEEMEWIKQYEDDEKMRKRREAQLIARKNVRDEAERRKIAEREKSEMEQATEFYRVAKERINCLMKIKEKEMREEALAQREILSSKVATVQEEKDTAENERIARVIAERDAQERAKQAAEAAFKAKSIQERIDDRQKYFEKVEEEKKIDEEIKKWEILNRIKAQEAMSEYDEKVRREKWQKILEYREELREQVEGEGSANHLEEKMEAILRKIDIAKDQEIDKMFFQYANEVLELAKKKNRSTYPIEQVIKAYKKTNRLLDENPRRKCSKHCYK